MCVMPLHKMTSIGIDIDSGKSISTSRGDFISIDSSDNAKNSVEIRGVGGAGTVVGGRGSMVISCLDQNGNSVLLVDPEGVYMIKGKSAPDFESWPNSE